MTKAEATLIIAALQTMVPPNVKLVIDTVMGRGNHVERYIIVASDGFRLDYAWQYLEMRIMQLTQMLAQGQRPQLHAAASLPSGLVRS